MVRRCCGRTIACRARKAPRFIRRSTFRTLRWCCAKAWNRTIDSYSAFYENDRKTPTGLVGYLRERGLNRVFVAGLAFDFCVRYSAEDAQREGFTVFVVEDACRGINVDGSVAATRASLATLGVACISALAAA